MCNYTNNDLFSRMAIVEEPSINFFFGEGPKNSQNFEILYMWGKYIGITS